LRDSFFYGDAKQRQEVTHRCDGVVHRFNGKDGMRRWVDGIKRQAFSGADIDEDECDQVRLGIGVLAHPGVVIPRELPSR
jgi:hypothetical protein